MGTIVVFENISLDGVTQDPTAEEGFGRVNWLDNLSAADREAWGELILSDALDAQALLLGRRSFEFFRARYPQRSGKLADTVNGLPKYVISATLTDPGWGDTTVLDGDVVAAVSALRQRVDGQVRVYASSRLVPVLLANDLVDELRLAIFPLVMGAGDRPFGPGAGPTSLRLAGVRTVGDGLAHLTYRR